MVASNQKELQHLTDNHSNIIQRYEMNVKKTKIMCAIEFNCHEIKSINQKQLLTVNKQLRKKLSNV